MTWPEWSWKSRSLPDTDFPCNLDVAFWSRDDRWVLAVESKFCEPFGKSKPGLKLAYVPVDGQSAWGKLGLARCDKLARGIQSGDLGFEYLDAPQLLKHILGLQRKMDTEFCLMYLFYDVQGPAGDSHRTEAARFQKMVYAEVNFGYMTYQQLVHDLKAASGDPVDAPYFTYVKKRYALG